MPNTTTPSSSGNIPSNSNVATTIAAPAIPSANNDDKKEALKTYIEQTKLLITLASAFIVAPAVVYKDLISFDHTILILMEVCFIGSVLSSYVVMGSIAGTQYKGDYNVYRNAIRISSYAKIGLYLVGLGIFIWGMSSQKPNAANIPTPKADTIKTETIINNIRNH